MNADLAQNTDESLIAPERVSADLSTELEASAPKDESATVNAVSEIDRLRALNPPVQQLKSDLESYASRKISVYESNLAKLEGDVIGNLPEYIDAMADVRDMNKLKYRLNLHSYDELKSLWLKYIHDIL